MKMKKFALLAALVGAVVICYSCEDPADDEGARPWIDSVSSQFANQAVYDDNFTIIGKNFSTDKEKNIVTFNKEVAEVVSASAKELVVKVPRVKAAKATIYVEVGAQKSNWHSVQFDTRRCDSVLLFQHAKVETLRSGVVWKQITSSWKGEPRSINVVCFKPSYKNRLGIACPKSYTKTSVQCEAAGALVGINASYFGGAHDGFTRINGVVAQAGATFSSSEYYFGNGVFVFDDSTASIKPVADNAAAALLTDINVQCSGPLLIHNGSNIAQENVSHCTTSHPRTVIGVTADGRVLFVTVDGRFEGKAVGMSTTMLQELLYIMGAKHALNLDGGGSTTMYIKDKGVVNHTCDGTWDNIVERKVGTVIYMK